MVKAVEGGVAAQLGLHPGDVITRLGGHAIETPEQFVKLVEQLSVERPVAMHIIREGVPSFVAFRLR
jgi:S1-C subfamily serine protease